MASKGSKKWRRIILVSPLEVMLRETEDHFYVSRLFALREFLYRRVCQMAKIQCDTFLQGAVGGMLAWCYQAHPPGAHHYRRKYDDA
ncbi:TPA: hypothetical protein MD529_001121 [Enterobacter hormaechei]|nr:hypothetical protein HMPREF9086_3335 [Enterobacter hormaechei ATCC 49162]HBV7438385.1 hypothetical protein [Enterobacter hormaechei]